MQPEKLDWKDYAIVGALAIIVVILVAMALSGCASISQPAPAANVATNIANNILPPLPPLPMHIKSFATIQSVAPQNTNPPGVELIFDVGTNGEYCAVYWSTNFNGPWQPLEPETNYVIGSHNVFNVLTSNRPQMFFKPVRVQ